MKALSGLRVMNTRPLAQASSLSMAIKAEGGLALDYPALEIVPTDKRWLSKLPDLNEIAKAIFISANAVSYYFSALEEAQYPWPATIQVLAVGQTTAKTLEQYGIKVDLIPEIADSEHLLMLNAMQELNKQAVLLIKGEGGRTLLAETLQSRGAKLVSIDVYRRLLPKLATQELSSLWRNDAVDIILFTSQQAMQNIFLLFGEEAYDWLRSKPCLVISERLAKVAATYGIEKIVLSKPEAILNTLYQFNQGLIHGQ